MDRVRVGEDDALGGRFIRETLEHVGHDVTVEGFTTILADVLASKDVETKEHSTRLVGMSDAIARCIGLPEAARSVVRVGACLHDVGKVAIPAALLRKPAPLTAEEVAIVRTHPEVGADILAGIERWDDVRSIVRHHHEHFDGSGYPAGLRGAGIPLGARIVAVVDAFDVMRSGRPYQAPRPDGWILEELQRERGRQFDPDLVTALVCIVTDRDAAGVPLPARLPLEDAVALGRRRTDAAVVAWLGSGTSVPEPSPFARR